MRIRLPFAGAFFLLLLLAGYAGLTSLQVDVYVNDKILHLTIFFLLTVVFYWIVDTNRRRTQHLTLIVCTAGLGVGSEFLQALLPNGRDFDIFDLVANVVGSLAGLTLCSWYHRRMLERKRQRKGYNPVTGAGEDEEGEGHEGAGADVELGEGVGFRAESREEGVTAAPGPSISSSAGVGGGASSNASASGGDVVGQRGLTVEEEVDKWDENAVDDWDDGDGDIGSSTPAAKKINGDGGETKKRPD